MTRPAKAKANTPRRSQLSTHDSPFYQLWVVTNLTAKPFTATFGKRFHLNLSDWRILLTVADAPGISAQALADYCGLDKMSVSRVVRNLEAQGRLVREGNEADRRMRHLYLTDDGWSVYNEVAASAVLREAQLYAALTPAELGRFKALLLKLSTQARAAS
jgi:DNA-binding MarR family transcriptional regulator